jgi:hypothetical protein
MQNKYIKTEAEGLVRDPESGAVLNVDISKLEAYRKQKEYMQNSMKNNERINKVENDLNEIKQMLSQLLKRS